MVGRTVFRCFSSLCWLCWPTSCWPIPCSARRIYAIGHSLPTSVVSGVPVTRTFVIAYATSGLCDAIAAVFYTARLYTGSPQLVQNEMLMDCIGAAVISGTSLFGGRGTIAGIALGVMFLGRGQNSLNLLGLRYWHVIMVKGGVILLAALLDSIRAQRLAQAQGATCSQPILDFRGVSKSFFGTRGLRMSAYRCLPATCWAWWAKTVRENRP